MISFLRFFFITLFFILSKQICFSQIDTTDNIKIGPEDLQNLSKGRYFNFGNKNEVNIEITVLGTAAGKYLIPRGTTLFDFLIMCGGTSSSILDDVKIVKFSSETPVMKGTQVKEYDFSEFYGDKQDVLKSQKNPELKPGDLIILPETFGPDQTVFFYIRETIAFVGTLVSFYYLIDNIVRRNR